MRDMATIVKLQGTLRIEVREAQYRPSMRAFLETSDNVYLLNIDNISIESKNQMPSLNGNAIIVEGTEARHVFFADTLLPISD